MLVLLALACTRSPDPEATAPATTAGASSTTSATSATSATTPGPAPTFEECFEMFAAEGPDYGQYSPELGHHCTGTNHQDISGIERVVFLGDSVTVGTPPTATDEVYRNLLADTLADTFGLTPPDDEWRTASVVESGDFASCAEWGARADDLMRDDDQILACFPEDKRALRTLVIVTVGGNDLFALTEGFHEGEETEALWEDTHEFMALVRDAVAWMTDPANVPGGVSVIFTNLYEYTDATGDMGSCPAARYMGFGDAIEDPALEEMVLWSMEEFMSIAVDTRTDMMFLLETFCGHGYHYDDPDSRCYRGPDAELWFDGTCIHPNPTGHAEIARMFQEIVDE